MLTSAISSALRGWCRRVHSSRHRRSGRAGSGNNSVNSRWYICGMEKANATAEASPGTSRMERGLRAEFEIPEDPIDELDDELDEDEEGYVHPLRRDAYDFDC